MKIDRLMGIILILLQKDKVTAPELAERFEVSRRTINRDIEELCRAGVPIGTMQGSGGGISILDRYKIDKTLLNDDELQAILSGVKGIDSISEKSYLSGLIEKLSNKRDYSQPENMILIHLSSHYQKSLTQKISIIKRAIRDKRCVSFRYYAEKGESVRCIEPYRLVFQWSSWYVFGYCRNKEGYRLFKLNRLWEIETTGIAFKPREITEKELRFDDYFSAASIHLKALFSCSEKYRLIEEYGLDCYSETDSGGLLFERDFASYKNMCSWILSFGDKVTILEPAELLEDRKRQAEHMMNNERT